jgi:RNA polymerase sigma-70 factor (ECF subfamily)
VAVGGTGSAGDDDSRLIQGLRAGDEATFVELIDRYGPAMFKIARTIVHGRELAEDVVQETWLAVLRGIHRFEGRAALRTWIFRILVNTARTHGAREARTIPFSAFSSPDERWEGAVPGDRFLRPDHPHWPGHWNQPPQAWSTDPETRYISNETMEVIRSALEKLSPNQRAVVALRDVLGCDADEVSSVLGLSRVNQRVLLHRARSRIRAALDEHLSRAAPAPA